MSSIALLDKTRKIGRLLHNNLSSKVVFSDICGVMQEVLASDVFVFSKRGKVLGCSQAPGVQRISELLAYEEGELIDKALNERFLSILSTQDNVNLMTLGFSTDIAAEGTLPCSSLPDLYRRRTPGNTVSVQRPWLVRYG